MGQPLAATNAHFALWVYPHVCGATQSLFYSVFLFLGLSPRVWGNPSCHACAFVISGSIPTCVGQPLAVLAGPAARTVYPHVCGATLFLLPQRSTMSGLSPRVWGNQAVGLVYTRMGRSIPTCVGQPARDRTMPCSNKVYPHVCGATHPHPPPSHCQAGLSPRVWGNLALSLYSRCPKRSIPTCVGQPAESLVASFVYRVYPHVCGATPFPRHHCPAQKGLSPRVWGNHQQL